MRVSPNVTGRQIVDLGDNDSRTRHGIGQMVDHQREVVGTTVGGQLQQDDVDRPSRPLATRSGIAE